jgi:hypothetical protein
MISIFITIVSIAAGSWIGWTFAAGPMLVASALAFTISAAYGQIAGDAVHDIMGQSNLLCAALEIAALIGVAVRLLADDRRRVPDTSTHDAAAADARGAARHA